MITAFWAIRLCRWPTQVPRNFIKTFTRHRKHMEEVIKQFSALESILYLKVEVFQPLALLLAYILLSSQRERIKADTGVLIRNKDKKKSFYLHRKKVYTIGKTSRTVHKKETI